MSLYKGTDLISGHQILYSSTGSNTDGAMTQKACTDTFANKSLSNINSNTYSNNFDGQWISSYSVIASGVTAPTSTNLQYSLSSILPNDGYNYEVLLSASATTGTTSGNVCTVSVSTDIMIAQYVATARTRTASNVTTSGSIITIVGLDREVNVVAASSNTGVFTLYMSAYRRIGTNS